MRSVFVVISSMCLLFGIASAWANGDTEEYASSKTCVAPKKPIVTTKVKVFEAAPVPMGVSATLFPGSLKENIERIANNYGWQTMVWQAPGDYRWVGRTTVTAENLQALFAKVLYDYPVQAVFYQGNHVLVVGPRNLP